MDVAENEEPDTDENLANFGWNLLAVEDGGAMLSMAIDFSASIPAYRGLPVAASVALEELTEYGFRALTEFIYAYPETL